MATSDEERLVFQLPLAMKQTTKRGHAGHEFSLVGMTGDSSDYSPPELSLPHSKDTGTSKSLSSRLFGVFRPIACCLRPRYSLRTQLLLAFGTVSILSIGFVMVAGIITTMRSTHLVKLGSIETSQSHFGVRASEGLLGELFHQKTKSLDDTTRIMTEATKDRFRGYPDAPGYTDDNITPFFDRVSQQYRYPIASIPLPVMVNSTTPTDGNVSNTTVGTGAVFYSALQQEDSSGNLFVGSNGNGNDTTATVSIGDLHARVSQYAPALLKALHEFHQEDVDTLGIHFVNDGIGASVIYTESLSVMDTSNDSSDIDCGWLLQTHPLDSTRIVGDNYMVNRCQSGVTTGNTYNPVSSEWFRKAAMTPQAMDITGMYTSPWTGKSVMTLSRAVYDDLTDNLIGVVSMDVSQDQLTNILSNYGKFIVAYLVLVWWEDGVVFSVATTSDEPRLGQTVDRFEELNMNLDDFNKLKEDTMERYHRTYRDGPGDRLIVEGRPGASYVSGMPFPGPPLEYDPNYQPRFIMIGGIDEDSASFRDSLGTDFLDQRSASVVQRIIMICCIGMVVVGTVVVVMAMLMTLPLHWINKVGDSILKSFGSRQALQEKDLSIPWYCRYAPRNEIRDLVYEFKSMILQFSGNGMAKLFKRQLFEVQNPFTLQEHFQDLYMESVGAEGQTAQRGKPSQQPSWMRSSMILDEAGPNFRRASATSFAGLSTSSRSLSEPHVKDTSVDDRKGIRRSRLFYWLLAAITIPLLATLLSVAIFIGWRIIDAFNEQIDIIKDYFQVLERLTFGNSNNIWSLEVADHFSRVGRDLHLVSRFVGWVYSGALATNGAFTTLKTSADVCKDYTSGSDPCPAVGIQTCDCAWRDPWTDTCTNERPGRSRLSQKVFFEGLNEDVDQFGNRNGTSFPAIATSPQTTSFWTDITTVPGYGNTDGDGGAARPDMNTTFGRLSGLSMLSTIFMPLYNYDSTETIKGSRSRGILIGFEADGMVGGYQGCNNQHSYGASFQSNPDNRAAEWNSDVCPTGKYGFDVRCTRWYADTKSSWENGNNGITITPKDNEGEGVSVSIPMVDRSSGEFRGAIKADMSLGPVNSMIDPRKIYVDKDGAVLVLSTTAIDPRVPDVIAGWKYETIIGNTSAEEVVMGDRDVCDDIFDYSKGCERRNAFHDILRRAKDGRSLQEIFRRTSAVDGRLTTTNMACAPVNLPTMIQSEPSNLTGGSKLVDTTPLAISLIQTDAGLRQVFTGGSGVIAPAARNALIIMLSLVIVVVLIVVVVVAEVTISVTVPVKKLLRTIKDINRFDMMEGEVPEFPEFRGGSAEVRRVQHTVERLFMLIRFATVAFFSGEVKKAHSMLSDALDLFTQLGNGKAMGIANNNLGNTFLTMYRTMKKTGAPEMCGMDITEVIEKGCEHFKRSIDIGEVAIERINQEEGFTVNYLIFMQQLSNRYFNRALFLLTVKDDHRDPYEAEQQGHTDLSTAKDMDREVVDNGDTEGFKGEKDIHFELLLSRIKGLLEVIKMGYEDDWGIEELFGEARKELRAASGDPNHSLFRDIGLSGQTQRLDYALIDYQLFVGSTNEKDNKIKANAAKTTAAKVAIRMLMEDEYLIADAARLALKALIEYLSIEGGETSAAISRRLVLASPVAEDSMKSNSSMSSSSNGNGIATPRMAVSDIKSELFRYRHHIGEALSLQYSKNDVLSREAFLLSNMGDVSFECF